MLRRPILLNRPLKLKKPAIFRPGTKIDAAAETSSITSLRRTPRLAEKLEECRATRG
jgi:hypothetical protein